MLSLKAKTTKIQTMAIMTQNDENPFLFKKLQNDIEEIGPYAAFVKAAGKLPNHQYHAYFEVAIRSVDFRDMQYMSFILQHIKHRVPEIEDSILELHRSDYDQLRSAFMEYAINFLVDYSRIVKNVIYCLRDSSSHIRAKSILWCGLAGLETFRQLSDCSLEAYSGCEKTRIGRGLMLSKMLREKAQCGDALDREDPCAAEYLSRSVLGRYLRAQ